MAYKTGTKGNLFFEGVTPGTLIDDNQNVYLNDLYADNIIIDVSYSADHAGSSHGWSFGGHSANNLMSAGGPAMDTPYTYAGYDTAQKFPFSISSGSTTDVGEMSLGGRFAATGHSSPSDAMVVGGFGPGGSYSDGVEKTPFSSGTTFSHVGEVLPSFAGTYGGLFSLSAWNDNLTYIPVALGGPAPGAPPTGVPMFSIPASANNFFGKVWSAGFSDHTNGKAFTAGGGEQWSHSEVESEAPLEEGVNQYGQYSNYSFGSNNIDGFPFSTFSAAFTDIGELHDSEYVSTAANQSNEYGYVSFGGRGSHYNNELTPSHPSYDHIERRILGAAGEYTHPGFIYGHDNVYDSRGVDGKIEKFPFAMTSGNSREVAELYIPTRASVTLNPSHRVTPSTRQKAGAVGVNSDTHGFIVSGFMPFAGYNPLEKAAVEVNPAGEYDLGFPTNGNEYNFFPWHLHTNAFSSDILKFPFAVNAAGQVENVGDLSGAAHFGGGTYNATHGFVFGSSAHQMGDNIDDDTRHLTDEVVKFAFTIDSGTASDVGELVTNSTAHMATANQ